MTDIATDLVMSTFSDPVELLLLIRAFLFVVFALLAIIYLEFHVDRHIPAAIHYALGLFAIIFMTLGAGVLGYPFPYPGVILSIGFSVITLLFGIGLGMAIADPTILLADTSETDNDK